MGAKYLSVGENCNIEEIPDIGEVVDNANLEDEPGRAKVVHGEIVGVVSVDMYKACRNCNAKLIGTGTIATCSKCNTKFKLLKCSSQSNY